MTAQSDRIVDFNELMVNAKAFSQQGSKCIDAITFRGMVTTCQIGNAIFTRLVYGSLGHFPASKIRSHYSWRHPQQVLCRACTPSDRFQFLLRISDQKRFPVQAFFNHVRQFADSGDARIHHLTEPSEIVFPEPSGWPEVQNLCELNIIA